MKRLLRRIIFILFWQCLFFLTVFYIARKYYAEWLVAFFVVFVFLVYLSSKVIPSRRREEAMQKLYEEYSVISQKEQDIRTQSLKLEMTCPSCGTSNSYWTFLEDYKCLKCGSDLWMTTLPKQTKQHDALFQEREKVFAFYSRIGSRLRRRLVKMRNVGL